MMPVFLFFSVLIIAPIIIHFLNFQRPKKMLFSRLDFIQQIEKKNKNIRNIKKWFILLSRVLVVLALVIAFSVPFWNNEKTPSKSNHITFLWDANPRLAVVEENITAKQRGDDFIAKYLQQNPNYSYRFATPNKSLNYFTSSTYVQDKLSDVSIARETIHQPNDLLKKLKIAQKVEEESVYILSDFHRNINLDSLPKEESISLIKVAKPLSQNVFVDTVYVEQQGDQKILLTRIKSVGSDAKGISVQLFINEALQGTHSIDIQKEGITTLKFDYTSNGTWQEAKIIISDEYGDFDNDFYVMIPPKQSFSVGIISNSWVGERVKKMLYLEPKYKASLWNNNTIDYQGLEKCNSIIWELSKNHQYDLGLAERLEDLSKPLILIPNSSTSLEEYKEVLMRLGQSVSISKSTYATQELDPIREAKGLFSEVFKKLDERVKMPKVKALFTFRDKRTGELFINNQTVLHKANQAYIFSFAFNDNKKLFGHALVLPLVYEMLNSLHEQSTDVYYSRSTSQMKISLPPEVKVSQVKTRHKNIVYSKVTNGIWLDDVSGLSKGFHTLSLGDSVEQKVAINIPKKESTVNYYTEKELQNFVKKNKNWTYLSLQDQELVENFIASQHQKKFPLWKYCIILALMFILIEILLIRTLP